MKKKILVIIIVCTSMLAKAQIILDSSNFPTSVSEIDSFEHVTYPYFSRPEEGINMNWDYSAVNINNSEVVSGPAQLLVINSVGVEVARYPLEIIAEGQANSEINLPPLTPGIYTFMVLDNSAILYRDVFIKD